jgi:phosphate transport system ATP-binding protein
MLRTVAGETGLELYLGREPRHDPRNGTKIAVRDVNFWYGAKHALKDVSIDIHRREVTAFIGPSGCGKTTLLRCLNRMNETIPGAVMTGAILMDGEDIYDPEIDPPMLRRRFGWVAQRPNPFPRSIYSNVAYAPLLHGLATTRRDTDAIVEQALTRAGLWMEVRDRLKFSGTDLSIGQQQRLCIARAIAMRPEVLLMDEPASALDPISTATIEQLIDELRREFTIVIVTHNMQQAARIAQRVAMFHLGKLVEAGDTRQIMLKPQERITEAYVTGRYG